MVTSRELRNVIKRSVLLSVAENITLDCLPTEIKDYNDTQQNEIVSNAIEDQMEQSDKLPDLKDAALKFEREVIINTLEEVNFNKSKAARKLNIDRKTLYN